MRRLIDKSFEAGPDQRFRVVALDDAIEILQQDQRKMIQYSERALELEDENRRLRELLEQAQTLNLHLIPRFRHLREVVRAHIPHLLEGNKPS